MQTGIRDTLNALAPKLTDHDATPQLRGERQTTRPAEVAKNFYKKGC